MSLKHLRNVPFFRDLPERELKRILGISQTRSFRAGEMIFNKEESAKHVFVVTEGRVKIFSSSGARKSKTFAYLEPGAIFGEMSVVDDRSRSASAQADEDCALLIVPKSDLKRLLLADSTLCFSLLRIFSVRLRRANEEIEGLLFQNILGRVAKALLEIASFGGRKVAPGTALPRRYTHQELAELIGTTREPLSRAISSLRRAGVLDLRGESLSIADPDRLRIMAGGSRSSS